MILHFSGGKHFEIVTNDVLDSVPYIPQKTSQKLYVVCLRQHLSVFLLSVLPQHFQTSLQSCTVFK